MKISFIDLFYHKVLQFSREVINFFDKKTATSRLPQGQTLCRWLENQNWNIWYCGAENFFLYAPSAERVTSAEGVQYEVRREEKPPKRICTGADKAVKSREDGVTSRKMYQQLKAIYPKYNIERAHPKRWVRSFLSSHSIFVVTYNTIIAENERRTGDNEVNSVI